MTLILAADKCTLVPGVVSTANPNGNSTGNVAVSRNTYAFQNHAFYAQVTYKLTDRLSLTGGLRYTWDKETAVTRSYSAKMIGGSGILNGITSPLQLACNAPAVTPTNPAARLSLASNEACKLTYVTSSGKPTWLIDIDYKPTESILLYAKYARGYRAGGINPGVAGAPIWKPEKIDNYEGGIKTSWHGAISGTVNLAAFYNDFQNQQVSVFIPNCSPAISATCTNPAVSGINGIQNAGRSRIKGLDADLSLKLFTGFRAEVGYAYLDAKIKSVGAPAACDTTSFNCAATSGPTPGSTLFFSPKNRVTVTGTYTLPLNPAFGRIAIGATFTHTDSQRFSYTDQPAFLAGVIPFDPTNLPATNLLNLNLNWNDVAGRPIDFSVFATNVTGTKYWVSATNGLTSTGAEFILLGEPRIFGARLKYRFGK